MWRRWHWNSLCIIAVMVSGSPPLFAQTRHIADNAAPPWKEEAGGMEPLELRQTHLPVVSCCSHHYSLFSFFIFFKQTSSFIGSTIRKSNSRAYSKEYRCTGLMFLLGCMSNCPLGQRAQGRGTARSELGAHAACRSAGWGYPNMSRQDMATRHGRAGTTQDWR